MAKKKAAAKTAKKASKKKMPQKKAANKEVGKKKGSKTRVAKKKASKKRASKTKSAKKSVKAPRGIGMTYEPPNGRPVLNPEHDFLEGLIFEEGGDYWRSGSGDSGLAVQKHHANAVGKVWGEPALSFFLVEPHGFFFIYFEPKSEIAVDQFVPFPGGSCRPWVEHIVCGLEMYVPRACFVPRPVAWEIVQEFLRAKKRSSAVKWVDMFSLQFPHPEFDPPNRKDLA